MQPTMQPTMQKPADAPGPGVVRNKPIFGLTDAQMQMTAEESVTLDPECFVKYLKEQSGFEPLPWQIM